MDGGAADARGGEGACVLRARARANRQRRGVRMRARFGSLYYSLGTAKGVVDDGGIWGWKSAGEPRRSDGCSATEASRLAPRRRELACDTPEDRRRPPLRER